MPALSTNQVAKELGIATKTLSRYIAQGKVPAPQIMKVGKGIIHIWTKEEVEALRWLLPKIKNGRKTRYQKKQQPGVSSEQLGKAKAKVERPQPRAAVPHKQRRK